MTDAGLQQDGPQGEATASSADDIGTEAAVAGPKRRSLWPLPLMVDRVHEETERSVRYGHPMAMLVVDLVARGAGTKPGFREAVHSVLRRVDIAGVDQDRELIVLFPETGSSAAVPARRLLDTIQSIAEGARGALVVCPRDGESGDELLDRARGLTREGGPGELVLPSGESNRIKVGDLSIVAVDPAMKKLFALVARLAKSDIPVLIAGETGVGKEVVATALHAWSTDRRGRLISINCAAVPDQLLESELFGHERGAFSGAVAAKPGLFELAEGGTIFLDEIGECSLGAQAKFLRALETKRISRIGSLVERSLDVRIVAATNRSLDHDVETGRFRQDLLFRLNAASLHVPPLRERPLDLPALANELLAQACAQARRPELTIAQETMKRLAAHPWPGNVRELKNVLEYVASTTNGSVVLPHDLPQGATRSGKWSIAAAAPPPAATRPFRNIYDEIRELERTRMMEALEASGGVRVRAAELIGMPLRTFVTKLREYQIDVQTRRPSSQGLAKVKAP